MPSIQRPSTRRGVHGLLVTLLGLLLFSSIAHAQTTWTVNDTGDNGTGTLRWAVASAASGDTVEFNLPAGSEITLTSGQIGIDVDLTISGPGTDDLTISGNDTSRVFNISNGANVLINHVTIANGSVSNAPGGGIRNGGNLTITDCLMTGNTVTGSAGARNGGAISNVSTSAGSASLTIERCMIENNSSSSEGGGIGNINFAPTLAGLIVRDSTVAGNHATYGGGIAQYSQFGGTTQGVIINTTISNNSATLDGGGVDTDVLGGGGVNRLTLINSTVHGNSASRRGGGLSSIDSGSIYRYRNSIVAGNTAAIAADEIQQSNLDSDTVFQGGNLIGSDAGLVFYSSHSSDQIGTATDRILPLLGPLTDNGGPTQTHMPEPGSPAIDTALDLFCTASDQRGEPRPIDGNEDGTAVCDSGAVEVQSDEIVEVALTFDPASLKFGEVEVGDSSEPLTVALHNIGDADLSGLTFSGSGNDFAVDADDCSGGIPVDDSCDVFIIFTPATTGPAVATLEVASTQNASASLLMSGTGTPRPDLIFQDRFQSLDE